jgi:hypothetical protein
MPNGRPRGSENQERRMPCASFSLYSWQLRSIRDEAVRGRISPSEVVRQALDAVLGRGDGTAATGETEHLPGDGRSDLATTTWPIVKELARMRGEMETVRATLTNLHRVMATEPREGAAWGRPVRGLGWATRIRSAASLSRSDPMSRFPSTTPSRRRCCAARPSRLRTVPWRLCLFPARPANMSLSESTATHRGTPVSRLPRSTNSIDAYGWKTKRRGSKFCA